MALDLSISALVNVGGALLFCALGIAILVVARRSRLGRLIGATAATFGFAYVLQNVLFNQSLNSTSTTAPLPFFLAFAATAIAQGFLTLELAKRLTPAGRRLLGAKAIAAGVGLVAFLSLVLQPEVRAVALPPDTWGATAVITQIVAQFGLGVLVAATSDAFRAARDDRERAAFAGLGLSFAPFMVFLSVGGFPPLAVPSLGSGWAFQVTNQYGLVIGLLAMVAIVPFAWTKRGGPLVKAVFPVSLAAGFLGLVFMLLDSSRFQDYYGAYGIIRTVSAVFLVVAIVRHGLLGVPLPHFAVKRGVLATGALAALFIVAQVAQNFFAAEYGLLMGGVVAGAVVFAASPLQRAMEARSASRSTSPTAHTVPVARRERTYRNALRLAMRDRKLTAAEEAHLFELAEDLGIGAGRAFQLKREVEAEAA